MFTLRRSRMKVMLRADSGVVQGTGHVMRCLTLAEELVNRGHEIHLMTAPIEVAWLRDAVRGSKVRVHECGLDELPLAQIAALAPDWLVVDSYQIDAELISRANEMWPVLAIIDGDMRDMRASLYLDQNLGADEVPPQSAAMVRMAGSDFALVRRAIVEGRRERPWYMRGDSANVLCFMGGTDPSGAVVEVVDAISKIPGDLRLTVVAPARWHPHIVTLVAQRHNLRLLAPTPMLPVLLAEADVVVSASGTSAWDICTLGVPAVLLAVVDNQRTSLARAVEDGLALGLDITGSGVNSVARVREMVESLLNDVELRKRLSTTARLAFDGRGAARVVAAMEGFAPRRV